MGANSSSVWINSRRSYAHMLRFFTGLWHLIQTQALPPVFDKATQAFPVTKGHHGILITTFSDHLSLFARLKLIQPHSDRKRLVQALHQAHQALISVLPIHLG